MKLKSILSVNASEVLSKNELRSVIGGSWSYRCTCGYKKGSPLVNECNISEYECVNKCRTACDADDKCHISSLIIDYVTYGSGSGSDSGSGSGS